MSCTVQLAAEAASDQRVCRRYKQPFDPWRCPVFSFAIILLILTAVVGSAAMSGVIFWLTSRLRRLESAREPGGTDLLSSHLDELTAELSVVRDQLDKLEQRTEFNERLLEGRMTAELPASPEE